MHNVKYMQSLDNRVYSQLSRLAKQKGISVQQLIRAIIIPDWLIVQDSGEATSRKSTLSTPIST
jgi:hypothetical protein